MTLLPVADPETIVTRLSDGTDLVADVYRPVVPGRYPILLMRQPYGRKIASTIVLAHPSWYASKGYVVMVQDVRGRGDSGGKFRILQDDFDDGAETLVAAADIPGGDGRVATYGFSYQGTTQLMALGGALRKGTVQPSAMVVAMAPWDTRDHWAFEGGAFRMHLNQLWAVQMATENARVAGDGKAYHALRDSADHLCSGPVPARLEELEAFRRYTHYHKWFADDPDYWTATSPRAALAGTIPAVPVLHVGGWLDFMLEGTFAAHEAFSACGAQSRLMVGPWTHLPWGRHVGALDCGPEAGEGADRASIAFLDHVLKDADIADDPVRLFDLGRRTYVGFPSLPAATPRRFYLSSTGRAAPSTENGVLLGGPEAAGQDCFVHDPWRPAPAFGLQLGAPGGYQNRAVVDDRSDVAVYTSDPFPHEMTVCGWVHADLHVTSDRPSFDIHAVLSIVDKRGVAMAIAGGHRRVTEKDTGCPLRVSLKHTMVTVAAGQRIRLSLQAAAWPVFMINPGTGGRPEETALADCLVTTIVIRHGADSPSSLFLPVLD